MSGEGPGPEDDEIIDGEIVDDPAAGESRLDQPEALFQDVILAPCHHGCTCGLHIQTLYGSRVPRHEPSVLDHGEMGVLAEAAERATRRADDYHSFLAKQRELVEQAHGRASKALTRFEAVLSGPDTAHADGAELERQAAELTFAQREPAPRWLKAAAVGAALGVALFDAYFFQQTFLTILEIRTGAPWWERDIGLVAAFVFAIGVIAAGRILCGPLWRLADKWRRPGGPDDKPPSRLVRVLRTVATVAPPAAILLVLALWAAARGEITAAGGVGTPGAVPVMLLLLSLALTVIVLEVLVYNPYQAAVTSEKRRVRRLLEADRAVTDALTVQEIAWRDLRSSQDEVISFIRAELARPWHAIILPARLRHGRAGPAPVEPEYGVTVEVFPAPAVRAGITGIDRVEITYQIFAGVKQPQPSPGPLAETIRTILELHPDSLRGRHRALQERLFAAVGGAHGPQARP